MLDSAVTTSDRTFLAQQLGREPRGLRAVKRRNARGFPSVIEVEPYVARQPFPTMYWLTEPELVKCISQIEATGAIKTLEKLVQDNAHMQVALKSDHERYHAQRAQSVRAFYDPAVEKYLEQCFHGVGVGGVADFSRVRCFHMFYADHLVQPNTVGQWLEQHFADILSL